MSGVTDVPVGQAGSVPVNPLYESDAGQAGSLPHEQGPMLLDSGGLPTSPAVLAADRQKLEPPSEESSAPGTQSTVFVPQHGTAAALAQTLYAALKGRSELLTAGLQGLPSFRVFDAPSDHKGAFHAVAKDNPAALPTTFIVGLDIDHNRLVIEAPRRRLAAAIRLCTRVDAHVEGIGTPLEVVPADAETCAVAKNLGPA